MCVCMGGCCKVVLVVVRVEYEQMNAIYFCCIPWAATAPSLQHQALCFNTEDQTDECTQNHTLKMCTGQCIQYTHVINTWGQSLRSPQKVESPVCISPKQKDRSQ